MSVTRITNNGYQFLISEEDIEFVDSRSWFAQGRPNYMYVATTCKEGKGHKIKYLHRLLLNLTDGKVFVDHKNHNTLDNTRENLRLSDHRLNQVNKGKKKGCASQYIGVGKTKNNTWYVRIRDHKKRIDLGTYKTQEAAALAYNNASIRINGDHASLNAFPISEEEIIENENALRKSKKISIDIKPLF